LLPAAARIPRIKVNPPAPGDGVPVTIHDE
jgi:hypothetical protein